MHHAVLTRQLRGGALHACACMRAVEKEARASVCRPRVAFVSTPNVEYNRVIRFCAEQVVDALLPTGSDGHPMRDRDHKFEWTRAQFERWCLAHAQSHGYSVTFSGVGIATAHKVWAAEAGAGAGDVGPATQVCERFALFLCGGGCGARLVLAQPGSAQRAGGALLSVVLLKVSAEMSMTVVQVAVFVREEDAGHMLAAQGPLQALQVFDLAEAGDKDLHACAKEYVQLRKGMFQEAQQGAGSEGAESLLASLTGFALADDDVND